MGQLNYFFCKRPVCEDSSQYISDFWVLEPGRGGLFSMLKAMPHGSDKLPAKNRHEIRHLLCMENGSNKSWRIIRK